MRKKCIWNWNWHARKEIEYWDEWGKWHGFFTALSFIGSIIFIIGIPIPYLIEYFLVIYEEPFQYAITVILLTLPFVFYIETVFYERTYGGMLGDGVYYLNENGISTNKHYPIPMHLQECYKDLGYKKGDFPIAEEISATELSLPMYYGMTDEEIQYVIDTINGFEG